MSRLVSAQNEPIVSDSEDMTYMALASGPGIDSPLFDIVPEEELSWIDRTEMYLATTVHDFSSYIDHGFAKQEDEKSLTNRSYIQIRSLADYSHRGDFESDSRVSLRVDLPHTERRWDLIFETDPEDYGSLESKQRDLATKDKSDEPTEGAIGGFSLKNGLLNNWKTSFDIGVRLRFPVDPFMRTELRRIENLSADWVTEFKQQLFYYHSSGAGLLSKLNFYHALDEDESKIVTTGSSAQYIYNKRRWEILFHLGLSDRINNDHLLVYSTGISLDPKESEEVSNYWLSVAWHQNLYKNWLYLSIIPIIDAPRAYDYKLNPGGQLKLEMFFSKNRHIDRIKRTIPK